MGSPGKGKGKAKATKPDYFSGLPPDALERVALLLPSRDRCAPPLCVLQPALLIPRDAAAPVLISLRLAHAGLRRCVHVPF